MKNNETWLILSILFLQFLFCMIKLKGTDDYSVKEKEN